MTRPEIGDERTLWKIHDKRGVDDTRRLDLRIAHVELPDGVHFEQYVLRMPKASIAVPIDEDGENVLMIWRHRSSWISGRGSCPGAT